MRLDIKSGKDIQENKIIPIFLMNIDAKVTIKYESFRSSQI